MMTAETHGRAVVDALLDIVEAAMNRWHCGPEEAVAKIQALAAGQLVTDNTEGLALGGLRVFPATSG